MPEPSPPPPAPVEEPAPAAADLWARVTSLRGIEALRYAILTKTGREEVAIPRMLNVHGIRESGDVSLTPDFCEAFGLSATERGRLDAALAAADQSIGAMEVAHASAVLSDDGTELLIKVEPFPESGGQVYDQLDRTFRDILGPERSAVFEEAYGRAFDGLFNGMGTKQREVTIKLVPKVNGGTYGVFYEVLDKSIGGLGLYSGTSVLTWANVHKRLGALSSLLPAEEPRPVADASSSPADG